MAFLGWLQISAAILNLLPIPGLDGYAIIEPYLDPATVQLDGEGQALGHARRDRVAATSSALNISASSSLINYLYDLSGASPFLRANGVRPLPVLEPLRPPGSLGVDRLEDVVADVEVGVHVLHVVRVLERID